MTTKRRLVELIDFDRPQGGSFAPMVAGWLAEARRRNWATDAVLFESARDAPWVRGLERDGATLHFVGHAGDRELGERLGAIMDDGGGQALLHSHFHGFDMASLLARRSRPDAAIAWHVHSVFSRSPRRVGPALVKFGIIGRGVDAILCPAPNIVDSVVHRGAPRSRSHFIASAIDVSMFPPADAAKRKAAREAVGVPDGKIALLHFGWHHHLKGGDLFVETLARLAARGHDVIGLERGGEEKYVEHAERLGIGDRLRLVPPTDDVATLHASADLLVSPSRTEGMAYALLESLAVGTPVVATAIPGHAFLGEHMPACRTTGWEPAEIAAGIEEMLARSPETRERDRLQAEEWIAANLSVPVAAAQLLDRFDSLLDARP